MQCGSWLGGEWREVALSIPHALTVIAAAQLDSPTRPTLLLVRDQLCQPHQTVSDSFQDPKSKAKERELVLFGVADTSFAEKQG